MDFKLYNVYFIGDAIVLFNLFSKILLGNDKSIRAVPPDIYYNYESIVI